MNSTRGHTGLTLDVTPQSTRNGNPLSYDLQIDILLDRFCSLTEYTQKLAFPPLRRGITSPVDTMGWSKFRRIAYTISCPSLSSVLSIHSSTSDVMLFVWIIVSLLWYVMASAGTGAVFGILPTSQTKLATWENIVGTAFIIFAVAMILPAYWRWIEFFRDKRYHPIARLLLSLVFIVIVVASAIFSPYWLLPPEHQAQYPNLFYANYSRLRIFIVTWFLSAIPFTTFYYLLIIETLVLSGQVLRGLVKYLKSAHTPLSKEYIRKLALEPIPTSSDGVSQWRLVELTKPELEILREWAQANREGSDKRLIPTAILLGILGVFANTGVFSQTIDTILNWLYKTFTFTSGDTNLLLLVGQYMAAGIIIALLMLLLHTLLLMFFNLVVQTLIIETCIVVNYACEQCQPPKAMIVRPEKEGFWRTVFRLLP